MAKDRKCQECGTEMENKGYVPINSEDGYGFVLLQCPKSKNVAVE